MRVKNKKLLKGISLKSWGRGEAAVMGKIRGGSPLM